MSSNPQRSCKDKLRSAKCSHFCLPFDSHNYCPSCRAANRGDDRCVTLESPCEICASFSDEQLLKIRNRKQYVRRQKVDTSKDDELDLLGDESVESFARSQADLEGAADCLFTSPPHPQPLRLESLSLKTPAKTFPPTPGTALQQKIESKLKKSLGSQFSIQLQQEMGVFQASMFDAMKSLRDEFQTLKNTSTEVGVDQTSTSVSKPGTSKRHEILDPKTPPRTQSTPLSDEAMEVDQYGPLLPPRLGGDHSMHDSDPRPVSDQSSDQAEKPSRVVTTKPKKHADKTKHKARSRYISQSSSSEENQSSVPKKRSSKPARAPSDQDQPQHNPGPLFYREVLMADLPSQYAEEWRVLSAS